MNADDDPRAARSAQDARSAVGVTVAQLPKLVVAHDTTLADHIVAGLTPPTERACDLPDPLPMAQLSPAPQKDDSLIYAVGRINPSGGVAATQALDALDWHAGDRLEVSLARNVVIFRRSTSGLHVVRKKRLILVPASARQTCRIQPGDNLLLVAAPGHGALLVHPAAALDKMLLYYHSTARFDEYAS
jgi:hypothetical protein